MTIWNKCDFCGRFIGIEEFVNLTAERHVVTPDTAFTAEEYETFHVMCVRKVHTPPKGPDSFTKEQLQKVIRKLRGGK